MSARPRGPAASTAAPPGAAPAPGPSHPLPHLNPLVAGAGAPPIDTARGWLRAYDGARGPALDLSQAAPAHAPAPEVLARLAAAAGSAEAARYGPIRGDDALRAAVADETRRLHGGDAAADDVTVTAGANQAFLLSVMAVAARGDAVMLPAPWYFNHRMTLDLLGVGAVPLPCRPEAGFVPDPGEAERLLEGAGRAVRALVLVSPNNPTGAAYPPAALAAFRDLARRRGLWLVLDETYRDLAAPGAAAHGLFREADWREGLVQVLSFSKSFAIPGHRLGAVLHGPRLAPHLTTLADCAQICAARAGQEALAWAIPATRDWREEKQRLAHERLEAFAAALAAHAPGWRVDARGAYFAYVRHPRPEGAAAVAERLAREHGVLALPGPAFGPGQERHLRVAAANHPPDALREAARRMGALGAG